LGTQKTKKTLLIIDDDRTFCEAVSDYFQSDALETVYAHTGKEGLGICRQRKADVVLLDQQLPDAEGHTLCVSILKHNDQSKIIFITAYPSYENAVKAIQAGAFDYLSKPFELEELDHTIKQSLRTTDLERVELLEKYKDGKEVENTVLVGESGKFREIARLVELAASTDAPVLITGETGTGKNMVAKAVHYSSAAHKSAFVGINCAALPENLIEAELFGYEKGAFTGAAATRKGVFEMAEGGTLFLDEIGDMPLQLQSKLLSALDEKKVKRLGGEAFRTVDVRVIAATNANITDVIKSKRFREDLYYRLSVIRIHIPPLRERKEDIPELCDFLVRKLDPGRTARISPDEVSRMMEYDWPGNVRELRNIIERALLLQKGDETRPSELLGDPSETGVSPSRPAPAEDGELRTLEEVEKDHILHALGELSNNYSRTARALGISLSTLKRKIRNYGPR
jgi:DNA-binding NtrC family response regulator